MCEVDEIEELKRQQETLLAALSEPAISPATEHALRRQLAITELSIANLKRWLIPKIRARIDPDRHP